MDSDPSRLIKDAMRAGQPAASSLALLEAVMSNESSQGVLAKAVKRAADSFHHGRRVERIKVMNPGPDF